LLLLAGDQDGVSPPPVITALALTAQTTRETASRAINEVVRRGIIARDKQRWRIVSRGLLEDQII